MSLVAVGQDFYDLRLVQNGKIYECVVKDSITITRSINAASKLTCSILRDAITPECGNNVAFVLDGGHEQFYGVIVTTHKSLEWCDIEAYDQIYYMNRNKNRFAYKDATADQILVRLAQERGYSMTEPPQVENTEYPIPLRLEENSTDLQIITNALDITFDNNGKRFYLWDDYGNLCLTSEEWMAGETTVLISMGYLEDYSYNETLEGVATASRVEQRITDTTPKAKDEYRDPIIYTWIENDPALIAKYGRIEIFGTVEEGEDYINKGRQLLYNNMAPARTMSLTGVQGDITVRGGTPVLVDFFTRDQREFIRGWFRTTSVTHHFQSGLHTMDIECELIKMLDDWGNTSPDYYSAPE